MEENYDSKNTEDILESSEVPEEVKGWNWGAFSMSIFWGIGNKTYLPLLCLIPLFNIVWVFICGAKGNEWAWKDSNYTHNDVAMFKEIQKTWNRAGIAYFIINAVIFLGVLFFYLAVIASIVATLS